MTNKLPRITFLLALALGFFWAQPSKLLVQTQNGISEPLSGDIVAGIVLIKGTATHPDFLRYELAFFQESRPQNDWIVFAQGDQPVFAGTLAVWDTTVGGEINPIFPDGRYRLRLRVVKNDYNYDEFFITNLIVANGPLAPTLTPEPAGVGTGATPTAPNGTALAATLQANTGALPSLTPFPTPSAQATPENAALGAGGSGQDSIAGESSGLFGQLAAVDLGRFGRAFLFGIKIVAYTFAALALYLLLRLIVRRLRRILQSRRYG